MKRKEISLLVESWRTFINESESNKSFAACYCEYWKNGGIAGFGGIGSFVKERFTSNLNQSHIQQLLSKEENFPHLLYYLSNVHDLVDRKKDNNDESLESSGNKKDWEEFWAGEYREDGILNLTGNNVPSMIYVNHEYNDKVDGEKLNKLDDMKIVTSYIKELIEKGVEQGQVNKKSNPFHKFK